MRTELSSPLSIARAFRAFAVGVVYVLASAAGVRAEPVVQALPSLSCAVEAAPTHSKALDGLCGKLAAELGREVRLVDDVRRVRSGQGVQVIETDFTWYVVLLDAGKVRAFTRVSAADARGREVSFVARAIRALGTVAPKSPRPCLRIDPAAQHDSDVVYPWVELSPCTRTVLDVRDPWWEPAKHR